MHTESHALSPTLLDDSGAVVPVHSGTIKGVSTNLVFTTASGNLLMRERARSKGN